MSTTTILLVIALVAGFALLAVAYQRYLKERLGRWVWLPPAALSVVFVGFEIVGATPPGSVSGNIWFAFLMAMCAHYEHRLWKARQASGAR